MRRTGSTGRAAASPDHRQLLRLDKSQPLREQIKSQIQRARSEALTKSVLAKACNYTLTLWTRLSRFLEHPELELSNNLAENAIRPLALGRRNWLHIGSEQAGPRVAPIVSVVESCRRLKIPILDYLGSILPGLAKSIGSPSSRLQLGWLGTDRQIPSSSLPLLTMC